MSTEPADCSGEKSTDWLLNEMETVARNMRVHGEICDFLGNRQREAKEDGYKSLSDSLERMIVTETIMVSGFRERWMSLDNQRRERLGI